MSQTPKARGVGRQGAPRLLLERAVRGVATVGAERAQPAVLHDPAGAQLAKRAEQIYGGAMLVDQPQLAPLRRQLLNVNLASNFETRYWMQTLGATRPQLTAAVAAVGSGVEQVLAYLRVTERRIVTQRGQVASDVKHSRF